MQVVVRDNRVIFPVLRQDGSSGPSGKLDQVVITGAGNYYTTPMDVGTFKSMISFLTTAAVTGTNPTLDVNMQLSADPSRASSWVDSGDAFVQATANGLIKKAATEPFGKYIRFKLVVGGTNTPTFTVTLQCAVKS